MSTQKVSIRYLLSVAIGNPEPGVVNFNALYTVLQVISEKLDIQNQDIEIDSSFCPVLTTVHEDKSNVSSEKLVDHQIYDYGSQADDHRKQDDKKVAFDGPAEKKKTEEKISQYRSELKQHIDALNSRLGKIEDMFSTSVDVDQSLECVRRDVYQMQEKLDMLGVSIAEVKLIKAQQEQDLSACRKRLEHDQLNADIHSLEIELKELKEAFGKGNLKTKQSALPSLELTNEMKTSLNRLQSQLMEVKADICSIRDQMDSVTTSINNMKSSEGVTVEVFTEAMTAINSLLENASTQLAHLQAENDAQKHSTEVLFEHLNELKTIKIDKDEIEELLSEKADYTMLQRKVSVENMNADRRKLEKQLSEITECFVMNEERVQKQIGDIKRFLGDQSLEDMLFDFKIKVDKEIQVVRDAVKRMAEMKPDVEAAAARLRNLACISCDQEVVMRAIELNNLSKFGDAYVTQSIRPEVTLELHKLRDAMKISAADASETICEFARNFRHSGGMHTIVTPKDRVAKIKRK